MKNEGAFGCVFSGMRNLSVRCVITSFNPGPHPAFRSGRSQGIGHTGKYMPSPSSAMSSGRLIPDRVRHHSPSPLPRPKHVATSTAGDSCKPCIIRLGLPVCWCEGESPSANIEHSLCNRDDLGSNLSQASWAIENHDPTAGLAQAAPRYPKK